MRHAAIALACAAGLVHAQDRPVQRALVRVQVRDRAVDRMQALARQKAPRSELKKIHVNQPCTMVLSGILISPREVVTTALHPRAKLAVTVIFYDGSRQSAELVGTDPRSNLALVRVPVDAKAYLPLAAGAVRTREAIQIAGHQGARPLEVEGTVTQEHLAVALRDIYGINAGRSIKLGSVFVVATPLGVANPGSACLDKRGEVAGIVIGSMPPRVVQQQQVDPPVRVYQLSFVVPARRVAHVVGHLRGQGRVIRAYFGMQLLPVEPAVRAQFDLPASASAVFRVEPDTPASAAGLRRDDIVLGLEGESYRSTYELGEAMGDAKPGRELKLQVLRAGRRIELEILPVERR